MNKNLTIEDIGKIFQELSKAPWPNLYLHHGPCTYQQSFVDLTREDYDSIKMVSSMTYDQHKSLIARQRRRLIRLSRLRHRGSRFGLNSEYRRQQTPWVVTIIDYGLKVPNITDNHSHSINEDTHSLKMGSS